MSLTSSIEWTDSTWTPLRACVKEDAVQIATAKGYTSLLPILKPGKIGPHCEHVSPGCKRCYSETNNGRRLPANGTGLPFDRRARDLVDPFVDEKLLVQPLKWRAPKKVFVCSQTDLFGEWVTDEMIDRVFAVMALCPQHTFQVLTKRPDRMNVYFETIPFGGHDGASDSRHNRVAEAVETVYDNARREPVKYPSLLWPLPNVHVGVSCEDQATADERIPVLLQTPAAARFISYEPALGPVDLRLVRVTEDNAGGSHYRGSVIHGRPRLDWVIVGGESGPKARPFDVQWARDVVAQCEAAGVPVFVKQLGAKPIMAEDVWRKYDQVAVPLITHRKDTPDGFVALKLGDRKGGDWDSWPSALNELRVREFPELRSLEKR